MFHYLLSTIDATEMLSFSSRHGVWLLCCELLVQQGCAGMQTPSEGAIGRDIRFKPAEKVAQAMLDKDALAALEEAENPEYLFGNGDVLNIDVFGRPEVSGKRVIGPDGVVSLPLVGNVSLNGLTREQAQRELVKRFKDYFSNPFVTISVESYTSNQVTVLGRVQNAGRLQFPQPPTLAEVLASAGALPILDKQATLTRCAIMRGREKLIWVDLKALLNGDLAFNIRMKKGDIVFIPDSSDTSVYVLGSVSKPGSYRLTPRMTLLDAIAQAGGPNEDAAPGKIGLYRAGVKSVEVLDFRSLIAPDRSVNYALEDGDVIFVPTNGLADIGYFLRQISPAVSVLTFGLTVDSLKNK